MQIIYKKRFENQLFEIVDYIARDKIGASIEFAQELETMIALIPHNPFQYRASLYFDDPNIRDMTYQGYTIVYRVNLQKDTIEVLRVFNQNKPTGEAV